MLQIESNKLEDHDKFFCNLVNSIPAEFYFPQDAEANWIKSDPLAKKYIKNIKSTAPKQAIKESTKKAKRQKYDPEAKKQNTDIQIENVMNEKNSENADSDEEDAQTNTCGNIELLRQRLRERITNMKNSRSISDQHKKTSNKRKLEMPMKTQHTPAVKKNKTDSTPTSQIRKTADPIENISFGGLTMSKTLINPEVGRKNEKSRGVKGIKNLLKKAEKNQQKLEELKKTESGKEKLKAKELKRAIQQASGEKILDDPKMLKKALKKKEKLKAKSAKKWKQRLVDQKKTADKKKTEKRDGKKSLPNKTSKRAGFEGKVGESFLNKKTD